MRRGALLACLLAATAQSATLADETLYPARQVRGALLLRGVTARPAAMGGAGAALADGAAAPAVNPAGLGTVGALSALVEYGSLGNGAGLTCAAGAMPAGPGVAGLGVVALMYGAYEVRNAAGDLAGTASATDVAVTAAWAVANPPWFLGRGTSGVALEVVSDAGGTLPGVSAGVALPAGAFGFGLAVQHLGPRGDGALPALVRAGAAYDFVPGLRAAADFGMPLVTRRPWVAAGAEYAPLAALALRVGYRLGFSSDELGGLAGLGAGFGVALKGFGLDYAFQPFGVLALTHRISLRWTGTGAAAPSSTPVTKSEASASADVLYSEAASLYAAGRYDEALAKSAEAVRVARAHWQAWQMAGNCRWAKGDRPGALEAYGKSLEINPGNDQLKAFVDQIRNQP
ncbi:MAG: hypothetical protein AAB152_12955 [Candidatus Coatesbacteria bacterium]